MESDGPRHEARRSLLSDPRRLMSTPQEHPRNPLHGITLERMLTEMVEHLGWAKMGKRIPIRCFTSDPSIKSSLGFLRKTPWARAKVEAMYLSMVRAHERRQRE